MLYFSLYLSSLSSIIEKLLTLQLNFLAAIDAIAPESTPPLKQKAIGTSDLNLISILLKSFSFTDLDSSILLNFFFLF